MARVGGGNHPDTTYLREQGCEDPWFRCQKGLQASLGNTRVEGFFAFVSVLAGEWVD